MSARVNDIGTLIKVNVQADISTATLMKILFQRPDKTTGEWIAFKVDNQTIGYFTLSGDLSLPGIWSVQAYVSMTGWTGTGQRENFTVDKVIGS
jgi:hypothetical protein